MLHQARKHEQELDERETVDKEVVEKAQLDKIELSKRAERHLAGTITTCIICHTIHVHFCKSNIHMYKCDSGSLCYSVCI